MSKNLRYHILVLALLCIPPILILIGTIYDVEWIRNLFSITCHQLPQRSFEIWGNQMVVCSRCTGIWFFLQIGELLLILMAPSRKKIIHPVIIALFVLPIAVDGLLQEITAYESDNVTRLITGSLLGVIAGFVLGIVINRIGNHEGEK